MAKTTRSKMVFDDAEALQALVGGNNARLKLIERTAGVALHLRGNEVTIEGSAEAVELGRTALEQLYRLALRGQALGSDDVVRAVKVIKDSGGATPIGQIFGETILTPRSGRAIAPKGVAQKQYVELIRENDIVFSIGPAGTGKTYLAVAMAVRALMDKQVRRIILTRPAIEAGEKLGFLPGTLEEKIDPYLRPLLDALHDMLDVERVQRHMADGIIEVAPLAFMRGRAQPVSTPVLTYDGWRPIGELEVGDTVTGSDGWPTKVLGVFPQGTKPVFRVTATDGASTLCCAEHLWAVKTASDKRVLETREMIGDLGGQRYELPLLRAPVALRPNKVPLEPYALGRLLGSGSRDVSPRDDLALAELGLVTMKPHAAFIPERYLLNCHEVRLALLQGLLDADLAELGPTGEIRFTTTARQLRDDVVGLVRSLGGVAVPSSDAFVLEIRLPDHVKPFRLERKAALYRETGGGRPTRHITSIEPEGTAETVCIQVDAADSLYLTSDFLLTHNTLSDSFIILDEAQNTTPEQMKMFLTRLGFGGKAVVTGDPSQTDLPRGQRSGFRDAIELLDEIKGIGMVRFTDADVVRHPLVAAIIRAYDSRDRARNDAREAERALPQGAPAEPPK